VHLFTSHQPEARRYLADFDLPTHPLCWLRGHRAKAEVIDTTYIGSWLLVTCRTCGIRHSDPYLSGIKGARSREDAEQVMSRQHDAARRNSAAFARVRDGRDGYGHHRLELSLEVAPRSWHKPGIRVHIGDRWSETPFDGSLHGPNWSAYFSIGGIGSRLAHRLTGGEKRDVAIGAGHKGEVA
jgi:hypothetical protein